MQIAATTGNQYSLRRRAENLVAVYFAEAKELRSGGGDTSLQKVQAAPHFLRAFYLSTPHALLVMEKHPTLLNRLEEHFKTNAVLSDSLAQELAALELQVEAIGPDANAPIFYAISGTNQAENAAVSQMLSDFQHLPSFMDLTIALKHSTGIELQASDGIIISSEEAKKLSAVLDPRNGILNLAADQGVTNISITYYTALANIELVQEDSVTLVRIPHSMLSTYTEENLLRLLGVALS